MWYYDFIWELTAIVLLIAIAGWTLACKKVLTKSIGVACLLWVAVFYALFSREFTTISGFLGLHHWTMWVVDYLLMFTVFWIVFFIKALKPLSK